MPGNAESIRCSLWVCYAISRDFPFPQCPSLCTSMRLQIFTTAASCECLYLPDGSSTSTISPSSRISSHCCSGLLVLCGSARPEACLTWRLGLERRAAEEERRRGHTAMGKVTPSPALSEICRHFLVFLFLYTRSEDFTFSYHQNDPLTAEKQCTSFDRACELNFQDESTSSSSTAPTEGSYCFVPEWIWSKDLRLGLSLSFVVMLRSNKNQSAAKGLKGSFSPSLSCSLKGRNVCQPQRWGPSVAEDSQAHGLRLTVFGSEM